MEVSGRSGAGCGDNNKGVLCDPCRGDNEDENAVFYCTVCNEHLCDVCGKAHRRTKALKNHHLLDKDSMPTQRLTTNEEGICSKHSGNVLEYYCNSHETCCCSVCATTEHKQCSVQYIDDIATGFEDSNAYKSLETAITDLTKLLEKTKDVSSKHKTDVQITHSNFISDVKKFRSEINTILDSLEQSSLDEARTIMDLDIKSVDSVTTTCDTMLADIHEISANMANQTKYKQQRQFVIYSKKATTTIMTYRHKVDELSKQSKIRNFKFHPEEKIRQLLQSLNKLGQIDEQDRLEDNRQLDIKDICVENVIPSPSQAVSASYVGRVDVRHSSDIAAYCGITGGVVIYGNTLALVDRNNSSVKVVNVDNSTVISWLKLTTQPRDITRVNQNQVVVTCRDGKLVSLGVNRKKLSVMKELNIGGECRGIVYTNNTFIVSFAHPDPSVKIISMCGKILKTFRTDGVGKELFAHPWYITLSADKNTVFVSDCFNNSVTNLTLDGTVLHVFSDGNLGGPQGLALDRNGNVYIAGWRSNTIHRLSTEGKFSQMVLETTHGMERPRLVIYFKHAERLYISHHKRNSGDNFLSIFQVHRLQPTDPTVN